MVYKSCITLIIFSTMTTQSNAMTKSCPQEAQAASSQKTAQLDQELFKALNIHDETKLYLAIKKLVKNGANINAQDTNGDTPLIIAARKKQETRAAILSFFGARTDIANNNKETFNEIAQTPMLRAVKAARSEAEKLHSSPATSDKNMQAT